MTLRLSGFLKAAEGIADLIADAAWGRDAKPF
jgi:hypothetical protein